VLAGIFLGAEKFCGDIFGIKDICKDFSGGGERQGRGGGVNKQ